MTEKKRNRLIKHKNYFYSRLTDHADSICMDDTDRIKNKK